MTDAPFAGTDTNTAFTFHLMLTVGREMIKPSLDRPAAKIICVVFSNKTFRAVEVLETDAHFQLT